MAAKYNLKYDNEEYGNKFNVAKDFNAIEEDCEDLDVILDLFTKFLNLITYNVHGLIAIYDEEDYDNLVEIYQQMKNKRYHG